jgi:putative transposase
MHVFAYCIMPDHVHLLVHNAENTDTVRFVRHFKQAVGFGWKQKYKTEMWQKSFYDRALRSDEDVGAVVRYVLDNPVKAGFVDSWDKYEFCGSFEWQLAPGDV